MVQIMEKITVRYRFTRANNSAGGFLSRNRPSTDALGALQHWIGGAAGRDYTKLAEEDDYIDVEVTCNASDGDAGPQLEAESEKRGVERNVLP
jgi:hypothetical protein